MESTPKVEHSSNTVNVVIQAANGKFSSIVRKTIVNYFHGWVGQQQLIKIMRNPNGQPLTPEGFKAIVKEVTGQDASKVIMGKVWDNITNLHFLRSNKIQFIYLFY